jgi:catechol 2,3-dioxygenase-like lactoylglutathione lyase family enzyme
MLSTTTLALLVLATSTISSPVITTYSADEPLNVYLNAIGLGVKNISASTAFYTKIFGVKKVVATITVPNLGFGAWTEDIDIFPGARSSALVLMEWSDKRPYTNLPIKLSIEVKGAKEKQALIVASGGKSLDKKTESSPGALYATDLDGVLLELTEGSGDASLKSVGVGVSNLEQSANWWANTTAMTKGSVKKYAEWDSITLKAPSGKASELEFIDFHETPKRNTKDMPIKLVFAANTYQALLSSIQQQTPKAASAGPIAMFQFEPFE